MVFSFMNIQRQAAAIAVLRAFARKTVSPSLHFLSQADSATCRPRIVLSKADPHGSSESN
jgi:hypothetical protein